MNSKPDRNRNGIPLDNSQLKFGGKQNVFTVSDPGKAKEIDQRYGQKGQQEFARALVVEIPQRSLSFAVPDLSKIKGMSHKHEGK